MRWLPTLLAVVLLPLLSACPPDLCDRACTAHIEECGDEERSYTQCTTECTSAGTWRTAYVECVEAGANCAQIESCPQ